MAAREPVAWTLPDNYQLVWRKPSTLSQDYDEATLQQLVQHNIIKQLDTDAVKAHLKQPSQGGGSGGEAEVHIARWHGGSDDDTLDGLLVAFKVYRMPDGHGGFKQVMCDDHAHSLGHFGNRTLRKEVNVLSILQHSGFADRVPPVLGIVRHWGDMHDPPLHGYAMPAYRYGSLGSLMRDTCDRRVPESVFAGFFSPQRMTGEYSALMQVLCKLHTGERGLMLQGKQIGGFWKDLSSNNLLIQDQADGGCRLLLADPSMCFLISDLSQPTPRRGQDPNKIKLLAVAALGSLTAEALATPAGEALVARCLQLHDRLTALSQLKPPKDSPLVPLGHSLSWVATHFMVQEHPLVAAMYAAQGAEPLTSKPTLQDIPSKLRTFRQAVHEAELVAGCHLYELFFEKQHAVAARDKAEGALKQVAAARDAAERSLKQTTAKADNLESMLGHMCQEYGRVRDLALTLVPSHPDRDLLMETGHLDPELQERINTASAAATPDAAAVQPPYAGFLQQLPTLPAAAGDAASPSADLSSRTMAGGPGDASPATSGGGSGVSSPNKRKRGAEQAGPAPSGTILRFAVSRNGVLTGLPAFRLPHNTKGSNLYAHMVAQLSERFRGDVHQLLAQKQGPYTALLGAAGLQPAQLDRLVQFGSDGHYIEISAASFLPGCDAAGHAAAAPIIFHSTGRDLLGSEQHIECGGGSAQERAAFSTALQNHFQQCMPDGLAQMGGASGPITLLLRIAAAQLPQGGAAMPWVQHNLTVPAADLAAMADRTAHLFRKKV
ncbi:hypothetical protein COHA_001759 [Chlorella ohadii]|uniref:Protein kinase domain-containing protein n=1 Tax=Chlorella ohadii TaxID=2649997 RepID=A0AAD5H8K1_9CHLO|nr:hypothetical protein COHA_001759 [Chlorella ohadii]